MPIVWSIVGLRRDSDGVPGSWYPDIPDGVHFAAISGDTTRTVHRCRQGTDADSLTADPNRLMIVRTPRNFASPTRVRLGDGLDSPIHADGRFIIESAIGGPLGPTATVRRGIRLLLESWDDDDDDKPNAIRPNARGRMRVKVGPDLIVDRDATADEIARRTRTPRREPLP